ncbi:hypothetical protein FKM82_009743 [Ascaphus truei]
MDNTSETKTKLSKEEKKLIRKQAKTKNTLLRHEGVETISHPSKSLVVANGGLGNGVNRQQLLAVLETGGLVEALLMPPNKPYSFVTYGTTEEAIHAYSSLCGREISPDDPGQKITLYLSFVEKVDVKEVLPPALPPGLVIVEEFVPPEVEKIMLESIDWATDNDTSQKSLKHRRVKHYGYEFRYDNNNVDQDQPLPGGLPDFCNAALDKCLQHGLIKVKPDQLTINQYEPGQGIPPHIDTHSAFEDEIISISLGAEIVMDFKHPNGCSVPVMLPRRSLLVMSGESRYLWTHGITPRKFDVVQVSEGQNVGTISGNTEELTLNKRGTRTSFTFRKVRRSSCDCAGIGCDRSKHLVDICGEKKFEACVCDALSVPVQTGSFDACISVAVIHHFSTEGRRLAAIRELARLLRSGGQALVYVWAMEQEYKKKKSKYLKENKSDKEQKLPNNRAGRINQEGNATLPIHTNRTAFDSQDLLVPWHLKKTSHTTDIGTSKPLLRKEQQGPCSVHHRYYHVFCEGELEALCSKLDNITIQQSYHDQGNWCVIFEKS